MVHGAVPQFRSPGLGLGTTSLLKIVTTHRKIFDTATIAVNINVARGLGQEGERLDAAVRLQTPALRTP